MRPERARDDVDRDDRWTTPETLREALRLVGQPLADGCTGPGPAAYQAGIEGFCPVPEARLDLGAADPLPAWLRVVLPQRRRGWGLWLNPPYSQLATWADVARQCAVQGLTVACLVPQRTETRWWAQLVGEPGDGLSLPPRPGWRRYGWRCYPWGRVVEIAEPLRRLRYYLPERGCVVGGARTHTVLVVLRGYR